MAEQTFDIDAPMHRQVLRDGQPSDTRTAQPERREKRKRSPDSQSDAFEEQEAKRARKSPSPSDSADGIMAPWPSIGYDPRPVEPEPLQQFINEMYRRATLLHDQYDSDTPSTPETYKLHSPPLSPKIPRRLEPLTRTSLDTSEEPEVRSARTSPSESPEPILPKWPRTWSPPPPRKSAYALRQEYDGDAWPASPSQLGKRRRTLDAQSDTSEEPEIKRARTSPSESPEPTIDDNTEEPVGLGQWLIRTSTGLVPLDEYIGDASADQNPLPSPRTDDGDAAESDKREFPAVDSVQARPSTPKASRLRSRQHPRKRDPVPPQRKRRQPPKEGKDQNKRNKRRDEVLSPAVETFLRSKRSSRRDTNCKLWQLGDDGTACTVSRVR